MKSELQVCISGLNADQPHDRTHSNALPKTCLLTLLLALLLCGCTDESSTPAPGKLLAITVAPSSATVSPGTTSQFRATGIYSDGGVVDLTNSVTWSSSNPGVATVSNSSGSQGVATAVGAGSATITALSGVIFGSATITTAAVQSIVVTPASQIGIVGSSQQFSAIGILSNGNSQNLTDHVVWSTSNPAIATISPAGVTSAIGAGTVTVTATAGGVSGTATLTVVTLVSVTITPLNPTIAAGAALQFTATGTLSNAEIRNVTPIVNWSSANPAVVSIIANGIATAVSPGSTTISASFPGVATQSTTVTVQGPLSITVTPSIASAVVGSTQQFTASGLFADGTTRDLTAVATWSSSSPGVATISNAAGSRGLATAVGDGSTVIRATLGVQSSATLTVRSLASLAITPLNPTIALGSATQLTATGSFSDGSTQDLTESATWNSSAPTIASVSDTPGSKGLVSANALGSAVVTATFAGSSNSTAVTVVSNGGAATNRAFVTNFGNNTLSVIDTGSNTVLTNILVGSGPQGVAVDPSVNSVYVSNSNGDTVSVVDSISNTVVATVNVGVGPWGVAANPAANRVYVANSQSSSVSVIDTTDDTVVATIPVGLAPRGVAVNAAANLVYVTNFGSASVSVIDSVSNTVISTVSVGFAPLDVAVNAAASRAYVVNSSSPTLSVLNTATSSLVTNVVVGSNARGVAVNPAASRAYVTVASNDTLAVLDTTDNTVLSAVAVGSGPQGVAVRPSSNRVYVANSVSNTISVIDSRTNSVIFTISGLFAPADIAVIP